MARGGEELSDLGEARRHVVDHDDEDPAASSRVDESPVAEDKPSRRSEGLDTLKCYLREIRHSTLLTFKQEQQLGKRVMAGDLRDQGSLGEAQPPVKKDRAPGWGARLRASAGVLKGCRAACYPDKSIIGMLTGGGAVYVNQDVVTSGRIVTRDGPESARQFAVTVLALLQARGEQ